MIYGYVRVSTDLQTNENQKLAINEYLEKQNKKVDKYFTDEISGTVDYKKRELGKLLEVVRENDLIICTEISRLGRNLTMIYNITQILIDKKVKVIAIKNNFELADDIQSKVLVFAFGISAEIERQLISERTKQALHRKKLQGVQIGHYKGYKCTNVKLSRYRDEILIDLRNGASILAISNKYGVRWITARNFIRDRLHYDISKINSVEKYRDSIKKDNV